jgi:Spy/CpxP family protein refolding chaperone
MNKKILIGLSAVALLAGAGAAWAAGHHGHGMGMMQHMLSARISEAEGLIKATPDQRAQIDQSKEVIVNALQARAKDRRQNQHAQLVQLLTADKLDTDALYAIANQHAQEIQDLAKVIVPEIQKVHDLLTPQQRQILAQKAHELHQKHQQGGFGGPGE